MFTGNFVFFFKIKSCKQCVTSILWPPVRACKTLPAINNVYCMYFISWFFCTPAVSALCAWIPLAASSYETNKHMYE